jgi:flagellar basal-body rod protein FlgF
MLLRLQSASSAMTELSRQQDRTANNLANANTVGYRRARTFTEELVQRLDAEGAPTSARTIGQWADAAPGALETTGNPLDLALLGEGFFAVADADGGTRYTRAGRFTTDHEGTLRTPDGLAVLGADGPITLPPGGPIEVSADGEIRVGNQVAGTLRIVGFPPDALLERTTGAAFVTDAAPEPLDRPQVRQGSVELSNVDAVSEMTEMIAQHRLFESHQKVLHAHDALLGRVTSDLGRF